jgi:hypothetical protein
MPNDPKRLFQAALRRTGECPDLDALAAGAENANVQRHLANCSRCQNELAMLQEFESAEAEPHELESVQWMESQLRGRLPELVSPAPAELQHSSGVWERLLGWIRITLAPANRRTVSLAAASLLAVAGAGLYLRRGSDVPRPSAPVASSVWRSAQFAAISPAGDLSQRPSRLQWESVPGSATYRVELREVDGTVIWSGETTQPEINIPAAILVQLKPGRAFRWQASAFNAAGAKMAATNLQSFHILGASH